MRFLFVSDFAADRATGAAGTLIELAEALHALGHLVDQRWHDGTAGGGPFDRHFALGERQRRQVEFALMTVDYDVVIVSQPFAFSVYEQTALRYPQTLFLNRTHGWEARVYAHQRRFGWDRTRSAVEAIRSRLGEALARRACRRTARASQGIIAASSSDAEFIQRSYDLPANRVPAICYGTELPLLMRSSSREQVGMLFVGNWIPRKGSDVLERILPSLAANPSLRLTVVTDSGSHQRVRTAFSVFGDRLTLHGTLDRGAIGPVYASHEILLSPSLCEGFGKAALEGMRTGMCVVGFPEGGLADLAEDGVHALLAPQGDVGALTVRLREAVSKPDLVRRIGTNAQSRTAGFTWERTARETVEFATGRRQSLGMP